MRQILLFAALAASLALLSGCALSKTKKKASGAKCLRRCPTRKPRC